jgi:hypothetical protein
LVSLQRKQSVADLAIENCFKIVVKKSKEASMVEQVS